MNSQCTTAIRAQGDRGSSFSSRWRASPAWSTSARPTISMVCREVRARRPAAAAEEGHRSLISRTTSATDWGLENSILSRFRAVLFMLQCSIFGGTFKIYYSGPVLGFFLGCLGMTGAAAAAAAEDLSSTS